MTDMLQTGFPADAERHRPAWIDGATHALARAWQEVPAWARSPLAIGMLCAALAFTFLGSLALVVNGVVERSEAREREATSSAQQPLQAHAAAAFYARLPSNTTRASLLP